MISKHKESALDVLKFFGGARLGACALRVDLDPELFLFEALAGLGEDFFSGMIITSGNRHRSREPGKPTEDRYVEDFLFHDRRDLIDREHGWNIHVALVVTDVEAKAGNGFKFR